MLRCWLVLVVLALPSLAATPVDFTRDIEPILTKRCSACHGAGQQMAGIRFDRPEGAQKAIIAGNSAESKLIARVSSTKKGFAMPPIGDPLTPEQVELLKNWIDQGAKWSVSKGHWAFQPIRKPATPQVQKAEWVSNPIDAFVLARLEKEGIAPSSEAGRNTLIRRVSLDLTGLPPTPAEVTAFVTDTRPDAYERLVDRLLASPHYGEKWARPGSILHATPTAMVMRKT